MKLQVCLGEQGKGEEPSASPAQHQPHLRRVPVHPSTLRALHSHPLHPAEILPLRGPSPSGWISTSSHTASPVLECFSKHHLVSQAARPVYLYLLGSKKKKKPRHRPSQRKMLEINRRGWVSSPCCCSRKCHHGWTFCFHFFHHLHHFPDSPAHPP